MTQTQNNQRGFSILEALVTLGISSASALTAAGLIAMQMREAEYLNQKLSAADLARIISTSISTSSTCNATFQSANFVNPSLATFNSTMIDATHPYEFAIQEIPSGGASSIPLVSVSRPVSALSQSLFIASPTASPPGLVVKLYSVSPPLASITVNFDNSNLSSSLHPLEFKNIKLRFAGTQAATTISDCDLPLTGTNIRYEGGQNMSGSTCPATYVGGFCDNAFSKHITFARPFASVPQVIVSGRVDSIVTYCPCCDGAFDQIAAWPENITATGFDVRTTISPVSGGGCSSPYDNWSTEMAFDWIAVGQ